MGIQSKSKVFVGNLKFISSPCLDTPIDDEDVDVIYFNYDTWIIDRSEYLLV